MTRTEHPRARVGGERTCDVSDRGDDRRRELRHTVNIEVDYAAEGTFLFAYVTDISSLGIFLRTEEHFDVGTLLSLRFLLPHELGRGPSDGVLELTGQVVWHTHRSPERNEPGMGIKFVQLTPQQRSRVLELVRAIAYLDDRTAN